MARTVWVHGVLVACLMCGAACGPTGDANDQGAASSHAATTRSQTPAEPSQPDASLTTPPNILVLILDDLSWRDLGVYGNPVIHTPNIDRLGRTGLVVETAMLTTPQCSPSRISMLSGRYPHATGAEDLHIPAPEGLRIVPSFLRENGYFTGHIQKNHEGPHADAQWDFYNRSLDSFTAFLDEADGRPFFMWAAFRDPHRPYIDPERASDDVIGRMLSGFGIDPTPQTIEAFRNDLRVEKPHAPERVVLPPYLLDTPETRIDRALYYDAISRADAVIGTYLEELQHRGLRERTLVLLLSDNGAPFPQEKGLLYDAGVRTPLIVNWPNVTAEGERYEGLMSVIDLAPTFLDLAGGETSDQFQGRSFAALLRGEDYTPRTKAFSERNWHNCDEHMRSVRTDQFRLIRTAYIDLPFCSPSDIASSPSWRALKKAWDEGTLDPIRARLFVAPRPRYELFDLASDPWELNNLADDPDYVDVKTRLVALLDEWAQDSGDFPPSERWRPSNIDRVTGERITREIPAFSVDGPPVAP